MKKIINILGLIFTFIITLFMAQPVNAASASITLKSSKSQVLVGNTFTVTATISSSSSIGSWDFSIDYDTSILSLTESSAEAVQRAVNTANAAGKKSISYTFKFKAKKSGSAKVSISSSRVVAFDDENDMSLTKSGTTIKVLTQKELEATYSKNNYLKSLSVDNAILDPEFNKDTLEYNIELEPNTTGIKVNAEKEDAKASITGTGDIAVSEGDNKIEIAVTAQNGNVRTYIINAKVKELTPIEVEVNKKKYTVVRKKDVLTKPNLYTETTITMNGEEVPAFTNDVNHYTLVGLKDEEGNINLYIYEIDKEIQTFTLYKEYNFDMFTFSPLKEVNIPKGYIKTKVKIGEEEIDGYKIDKTSKFALIYGMNVETGDKGWYSFDTKENTLQRYNIDEIEKLNDQVNQYYMIIIILGSMIGIFLIIMIIMLISRLKKNKSRKDKTKIDVKEFNKK